MKNNTYTRVSGILFSIIAVLHLSRIVQGWSAVIAGWSIPLWLSWVAVVVTGYLAYNGLLLSKK